MDIKCMIGIRYGNGTMSMITCEKDGNPGPMKEILPGCYCLDNTEELLNLGNIISLGKKLHPEAGKGHNPDMPQESVTVACIRDRGDCARKNRRVNYRSLMSLLRKADRNDVQYLYFMDMTRPGYPWRAVNMDFCTAACVRDLIDMKDMKDIAKRGKKPAEPVTRQVCAEIIMLWEDAPYHTLDRILFTVPDTVTNEALSESIKETHENLSADRNGKGIYDVQGRTGEVLAKQVCAEKGWQWETIKPDITLNLD